MLNTFKSFVLSFLLFVGASFSHAQEVFNVKAEITINGEPNLVSTLILLEQDRTEVASQYSPAVILSAKAKIRASQTMRLMPNLQIMSKTGEKILNIKPLDLQIGETKTGFTRVADVGNVQWSFNLQSQRTLKEEIPTCLYSECK